MIPVNEPWLEESDLANITDCVRTGWISSAGTYIESFERGWAAYCGRKHGIAVANGTVALDLAVAALSLEKGSEVILPSFTIISCVTALLNHGLVPVLVDCDPDTWCMDVEHVASKITLRTKAIMPVHIYGHPVDMDPLLDLADKYGLAIIEDAAEVHGSEYLSKRGATSEWKRCGSFGEFSCFSFYANKIVTTGEGGMVLTDDDRLAERARSIRNLCFGPQRFLHRELGYNYRLTNMQAALGVAQLGRIDRILERKAWLGRSYAEGLSGIEGLQLPVERAWAKNVWWMFGVVLDDGIPFDASAFAEKLKNLGVDTRPFFQGMHLQPALLDRGLFEGESYPVTERISRRGLYLPSGLKMTQDQMRAVCSAVREALS
ncbi:MAG: DegT/DnrJ/EryC1/StrS family aminotransferase [Alphaproteobacteria bacterium]|nr:DegT/DnrJ/EryC1/StrS family aminotransferase [Alphaproteobacteria bacterium]